MNDLTIQFNPMQVCSHNCLDDIYFFVNVTIHYEFIVDNSWTIIESKTFTSSNNINMEHQCPQTYVMSFL